MLGLPPSVRIYFATELTDMRNGDGLRAIVEGALRHDPYDGHLFVFVGKAKDKVKILFWDRSGFVLYLKRLEKGRFQLPIVDARRKHVTSRRSLRSSRCCSTESISTPADSLDGLPTIERGSTQIAECDQRAAHARADEGDAARPRGRADAKAETPTVRLEHEVPEPLRRCTTCSCTDLAPYRVEHDAKEQRLSETAHFEFRKQRAGPMCERLKAWLDAQRPRHPPKSPLGVAGTRSASGPSSASSSTTRAYRSTTTRQSGRSGGSRWAGRTTTCGGCRFGQEPRRPLLARRHA